MINSSPPRQDGHHFADDSFRGILANEKFLILIKISLKLEITNIVCNQIMMLFTQITKFMGPTGGPPGSCRPQMGPMLAPWTLLSVAIHATLCGYPLKFKQSAMTKSESRLRHIHVYNKSINSSPPSAAYMHQWIGSSLVQIMACRLLGPKSLSKPMLSYCQLNP